MPIVETDIVYRLTTTAGAAGDTTAQGDPNASLGKFVSTTPLDLVTTLHNLWDLVASTESAAGDTEHRAIAIVNKHPTLTLQSPVVWILSEVAGGASIEIGLDPAGVVALGLGSPQGAEIADESTPPAGVTFSAPTSKGAGLAIGDLAPDTCRLIWLRRTVPAATPAANNDGATLRVEGDTAA